MRQNARTAAIQHIDWEPFVEHVSKCQHPKVTQLMTNRDVTDDAIEEIILMLGDQLDGITGDTDSHDAALEWAATEYDIPLELLSRIFYDESTPLADLVRSGKDLPGMKKGRRTPLARLISVMYGTRYKNEKDWQHGKRALLNFSRAVGPKFYRRVMPIIQLAENPKEAVQALVELGRKKKPHNTIIKGSWNNEHLADTARRIAGMGLGEFNPTVRDFELKTNATTLRVFGIAKPTPHTEKMAGRLLTACRKQQIQVIDLDAYQIGNNRCLTAKLRLPQNQVQHVLSALQDSNAFQIIEIQGLG